ncbi:DEP domain-containing protein 1A [Lepeophtheirus salmonis]|uniref:DEP domain-containing protein 1A n=1 Tax=Lepeophtheirus salmonis TaxID=72036 RepID=UPI001AE45C03|nr:DEP domain-containing protein 1B-like [Lepeophtheirus salmonis]
MEEEPKGPWRATRLWNEIVGSFQGGMPLKRHRKSVLASKAVDNCFSGSEAVDWLHKYLKRNANFGVGVSKDQTLLLLEKLLKAGIFRAASKGQRSEIFKESELYVFPNDIERLHGSLIRPRDSILHPLILMDKGGIHWKDVFLSLCALRGLAITSHIVNLSYLTDNMTKVSNNGVVLPPEDRKQRAPHWVMSAIKCLADWPVSTSESENPLPNYKGFENDVFNVIREYFTSLPAPLIPHELYSHFASAYLRASLVTSTPLYNSSKKRDTLPPKTCYETAFMQESPVTRIVAQKETDSLHLISPPKNDGWDKKRYKLPGWRRSSRSRKSIAVMEKFRFRAAVTDAEDDSEKDEEYHKVSGSVDDLAGRERFPLSDVPSVIQSKTVRRQKQKSKRDRSTGGRPEDRFAYPMGGFYNPLVHPKTGEGVYESTRFGDLIVKTPKVPFGPSSADSVLNEVEKRKNRFDSDSAIRSFQLLALLLRPSDRRKVQLLLRFIRKASSNPELILSSTKSTCELLLGTFQGSILAPSDITNCDEELVRKIVSFFVRNYEEIWTPPECLRREVEERVYESLVNSHYSEGERFPITYCHQVSKENYEKNKDSGSKSALQDLLIHLLYDKKISARDRKKKVKKFKDSYPDIYRLQFPNKDSEPEYMNKDMESPKLSSLTRFKNAMRI